MKKIVRLNEKDIKSLVKKIVKENKMGLVTTAAIGMGVVLFTMGRYNQVTVIDVNGNEREPQDKEVFTGEIIHMKPYGRNNAYQNPTGYDFKLVTSKGEEVSFRVYYSDKAENLRKGDTISIRYDDDALFFDPSAKIVGESSDEWHPSWDGELSSKEEFLETKRNVQMMLRRLTQTIITSKHTVEDMDYIFHVEQALIDLMDELNLG